MNEQSMARYEQLLGHKLSTETVERLRRISDVLRIAENDALWDIIIAMEYQRSFYEALPQKIEQSSANLLENLSQAAQQEVSKAQATLAESVVEQAKNMSLRENMKTYLIWGNIATALIIIYGSLMLWAGHNLVSASTENLHAMLRLPMGIVFAGLSLCGGIFASAIAAHSFSEGKKVWKGYVLMAMACISSGAFILAIFLQKV